MHILYVAPFLSVPPNNGAAVRAFHLIRHLSKVHRVSVITYQSDGGDGLQDWARQHLHCLTLLPAVHVVPTKQNRVETLKRIISFPPGFLQRYPSAELISAIDREFDQVPAPDIIVFDTLMTGRVIRSKRWPVHCVLTLYDVLSNYQRRLFSRMEWRPFKIVLGIEWLKVWYYEMQVVRSFSTLVAVSSLDAVAIKRMHPSGNVVYVPNGVDTTAFAPLPRVRCRNLLFVGNWDYAPNAEALWYFYEKIWPRIHSQADVRFLVVGRHVPASFTEIARHDTSIQVASDVPDVRPFYEQAEICVVPLLNGEGTRLKILEAFALGVPVVSTSVGCEGLDVQDGRNLLIADGPEIFAEAVLRLLHDPYLGTWLAENARALVESQYDWELIAGNFHTALDHLKASN